MNDFEKQSVSGRANRLISDLKQYSQQVHDALVSLRNDNVIRRIWDHDHTVWKDSPEEITNRLGWLHLPENMPDQLPDIFEFVNEVRDAGFTHALLLGMGGSSLAPELFRLVFGVKSGYPDVAVLDNTDPEAVQSAFERSDPHKTLYIVSTKSGGTVETMSFMKYCYNRVHDSVGSENAGNHFIAITDPGSGLEKTARELKFRRIFLNDPEIGGRYSALSLFGLVPAALVGIDIELLLERAAEFTAQTGNEHDENTNLNESVLLGTTMGVLASQGRDKLTIVLSEHLHPLGSWIEQLVAESTGKEKKGILPVLQNRIDPARTYNDRFVVYLYVAGEQKPELGKLLDVPEISVQLTDLYDIGKEFFRWEFATAVSAHLLKINPFDQPNVESAKIQARNRVTQYMENGKLPEPERVIRLRNSTVESDSSHLESVLKKFFSVSNAQPAARIYFSIQAFIKPDHLAEDLLNRLRLLIEEKYDRATTVGYGPRFLHSTGQLHKGDAGLGRFVQIISDKHNDVAIPEKPGSSESVISFGILKKAQAFGDREALQAEGRNVITFLLSEDYYMGLEKIEKLIQSI